jgi:hypothetical protein
VTFLFWVNDLWLDPGMNDVSAASELLRPSDARVMGCYPVSSRLNHVGNDDGGCCKLVELARIQNRLFLLRRCEAIRNF